MIFVMIFIGCGPSHKSIIEDSTKAFHSVKFKQEYINNADVYDNILSLISKI